MRSGWWDVARTGSAAKIGEYQGLNPSLFWDLDVWKSDGQSTLDLYGTGLDNETTQSGLYLFTPPTRQSAVRAVPSSPGPRSVAQHAEAG